MNKTVKNWIVVAAAGAAVYATCALLSEQAHASTDDGWSINKGGELQRLYVEPRGTGLIAVRCDGGVIFGTAPSAKAFQIGTKDRPNGRAAQDIKINGSSASVGTVSWPNGAAAIVFNGPAAELALAAIKTGKLTLSTRSDMTLNLSTSGFTNEMPAWEAKCNAPKKGKKE